MSLLRRSILAERNGFGDKINELSILAGFQVRGIIVNRGFTVFLLLY